MTYCNSLNERDPDSVVEELATESTVNRDLCTSPFRMDDMDAFRARFEKGVSGGEHPYLEVEISETRVVKEI